jgi:hypothetical protein
MEHRCFESLPQKLFVHFVARVEDQTEIAHSIILQSFGLCYAYDVTAFVFSQGGVWGVVSQQNLDFVMAFPCYLERG